MYVRACAGAHVCMSNVYVCVCMFVRVRECVYVSVFVHVRAFVCVFGLYVCTRICSPFGCYVVVVDVVVVIVVVVVVAVAVSL